MRLAWRHFAVLGLATLLLAACGTDVPKRAYIVGQSYSIMQKGALTYVRTAEPSAATVQKIVDADQKASPQVQAALECAAQVVEAENGTGTVDPQATALGLSASEVADAKEEACDAALARANEAVQSVGDILKGGQ